MTLKVMILVGNPSPGSRTRAVSERLVEQLFDRTAIELEIVELSSAAGELFDPAAERVRALTVGVADADVVVVATPTYKGTYTGLLKAFLDRCGTDGLGGVIVIPVMTGGDVRHSLAVNGTLVPLLLELGATIPGRGLYVPMDREHEHDARIADAARTIADCLRRLSALQPALRR